MTNRQIDLKRNGIEQAAFTRLLDFSESDAEFEVILSDKRQKKQKFT